MVVGPRLLMHVAGGFAACSWKKIQTTPRCKSDWNAVIGNQLHDLKVKLTKNSDPGRGKGVANLLNLLDVDTYRFR